MKILSAVIGLAIAFPVVAQQGVGAKFGTRDPRVCASTKAPGKVLDLKTATAAVLCYTELVSSSQSHIYLVDDLKIEIAPKGRPYNPRVDLMSGIDVDMPVYAIRGSFVSHQCAPLSDILANAGKNCHRYQQTQATGTCSKTTFGEWKCSFMDLSARPEIGVPPPKT